jgi:lysophospholipid acyltransferase (LPLAT)-like uncharacterized protein
MYDILTGGARMNHQQPFGPRRWDLRRLRQGVITWLTFWVLRGLCLTLRPTLLGEEKGRKILDQGQPVLVAIWHGRLLYFLHLYMRRYRRFSVTVLVSRSRDGEFISQVAKWGGVHTTRGSSRRGGSQALLGIIKQVHQGTLAMFTPDGPRGPRYRVQPGIVTVAKKTGAPIVPVTYNARWKKVMQSWDRFVVPLPFSRVVVVCGDPIYVPAEASAALCEAKRQEVETGLHGITAIADGYFAGTRR